MIFKYVRREQAVCENGVEPSEMHNANFAVNVVEYVEIDFHGLSLIGKHVSANMKRKRKWHEGDRKQEKERKIRMRGEREEKG